MNHNQRILVTGGDGLLAHALNRQPQPGRQLIPVSRPDFDLTNPRQMAERLDQLEPGVVINTAAYNLVDRCETERALSWAVNATGPETLAGLCAERHIRLVHFGTDYVFDGLKSAPYVEDDPPAPLNHYAAGKLSGEQAVLRASARNLVLRTSWIFGWHPTQSKTFVHAICNAARAGRPIKSVTDQCSAPTFAGDLADWTLELLAGSAAGLFHAVNDGGLTRYDWTIGILTEALALQLIPAMPVVDPVAGSFFNPTMRRPGCTVLDNGKLSRQLGRRLGSWRPGLRKMLARMK